MLNNVIKEESTSKTGASKRMPFKAEEDEKLRELVKKYGDKNWQLISTFMPNRSVRQCRERWNYNLASNVIKDKWSAEEDDLLIQKYKIFGPKWKILEKFFKGRTSYNIRNRWLCIVRLWNIYSNQPKKYEPKRIDDNQYSDYFPYDFDDQIKFDDLFFQNYYYYNYF